MTFRTGVLPCTHTCVHMCAPIHTHIPETCTFYWLWILYLHACGHTVINFLVQVCYSFPFTSMEWVTFSMHLTLGCTMSSSPGVWLPSTVQLCGKDEANSLRYVCVSASPIFTNFPFTAFCFLFLLSPGK